MSRSKKSRKPGSAPTAKPKLSKQELATVEKRVRKKKGKQAGNRQQEATQQKKSANPQNANKDSRLGNKTPIVLGKLVAKVEKAKVVKKESNIAAIRIVEKSHEKVVLPVLSVEEQIDAIEQDEQLQIILTKHEENIALTEDEVNYYNDLMERHEELSAELGEDEDYYDEDEDEDEEDENQNSEDDLWDKLDRSMDKNDYSDLDDK